MNRGQPAVNLVIQSNELDSDSSLEPVFTEINEDSNDKDMDSKGPGVSRISPRYGRSRRLSLDEGNGSGSG